MLSGDKWGLAGRGARFDLRRKEEGATLLEECMFGRGSENEGRRRFMAVELQSSAVQTDAHGPPVNLV